MLELDPELIGHVLWGVVFGLLAVLIIAFGVEFIKWWLRRKHGDKR